MIALLVTLFAVTPGSYADPCRALIPAALTRQLESANVLHRIPRVSDATCRLVEKKSPCLLATAGDFNGDGREDYAIVMPFNKGPGPSRFLVAFGNDGGWEVHQLTMVRLPRIDQSILSTLPPGRYRETAAVLPTGVTGRIVTTKTDGIKLEICGTSATALFHLGDGWFPLALSD